MMCLMNDSCGFIVPQTIPVMHNDISDLSTKFVQYKLLREPKMHHHVVSKFMHKIKLNSEPVVKFLELMLTQKNVMIKNVLSKKNGYFSRFFSSENWQEWTENRTQLGRIVDLFESFVSGESIKKQTTRKFNQETFLQASREAEQILKQLELGSELEKQLYPQVSCMTSLPLATMTTPIFKSYLYHGSLIFSLFKTAMFPISQVWWNTILEGKIILGAIPLKNKGHDDSISKQAHSVLTLLENFEIYSPSLFSVPVTHHDWHIKKITQKHIVTEDFEAVPLGAIIEGVAFLREQILQNKTVYVHCKAGRGRSATIVVSYILKYCNEIFPSNEKCSVEKAIAFVRQQRPVINLNSRQRKAIEDYYFSDVPT
ncbi:MAG: dual specificity protein phosphatase family protein [Parachlamydiaceae bacterium]|nr:dual specificity protein phosphatase family protein [Parachlamydiaceae bacterium]